MKEELPKRLTGALRACGAMGLVRRLLGGQGLIVVLHEVHDDPASELVTGCPPETLAWVIEWLRGGGWDFVDLHEAARRIAEGGTDARASPP